MLEKIKFKHKPLWLRFFIPYLIILIVPLMIGMFSYSKTSDMMSTEAGKTNQMLLNQARNTIDRRLSEIELLTQRMGKDSGVISFMGIRRPYEGTNPIRLLETRKSLAGYGLYNNFILDYGVLFKNSEIALTSHKTYTLSSLFQHYLTYENVSYEDWYDKFVNVYHSREYFPSQQVSLAGKSYDAVTYIQSLGMEGSPQGAVFMMIDDRAIRQMLGGIDVTDGGFAYIADRNGEIISKVTDGGALAPVNLDGLGASGFANRKIDGKTMSVTYTTSDYNGWKYVAVQPAYVVMKKVYSIKRLTMTVLSVSLLIGLFCALYLSYRNSRPVQTLVARISDKLSAEQGFAKDAYGFIDTMISRLISNNEELKSELEAQKPFLKTAFIQRLVTGNFMTIEEIKAQQRHIGVNLQGSMYFVAQMQFEKDDPIVRAELLEELDIKRVVAKELIRSVAETDVVFHDAGENKIAVLFVCGSGSPEECRQKVSACLEQAERLFLQKFGTRSYFAAGSGYRHLLEVARSFEEAKWALNYKVRDSEEGILWYDDLPVTKENYVYPGDVESRLINFAKAGSKKEVCDILEQLHKWNFRDRQLSPYIFKLFLYELSGSFMKLMNEASIADAEIEEFVRNMISQEEIGDQSGMFESVKDMLLKLCDIAEKRKKSRNNETIRDIVAFLHASYTDESLNLAAAADRFHLSEMYLSQFFKEQTGVNFSSYIEELRMERARELLAATKLTVNEIASAVGYNSSNTFCRAFKRIHATTPLVYRKSARVKPDRLVPGEPL